LAEFLFGAVRYIKLLIYTIGSYLYFFKNPKDLMPSHYLYIMDAKIIPKIDLKLWTPIS